MRNTYSISSFLIATVLMALVCAPVSATTIYGDVWYDLDVDGIVDAGEPGMEGFGVALYMDEGADFAQVAYSTTSPDGDFGFSGLEPDSYFLRFYLPQGWLFSGGSVSEFGEGFGDTPAFFCSAGESVYKNAGVYPDPDPGSVPEPSTIGLVALALAGLAGCRRKKTER